MWCIHICDKYIYTPPPFSPLGKHAVLKFEWIVLNLCIVILRNQRNLTSEHNHFFLKQKKKRGILLMFSIMEKNGLHSFSPSFHNFRMIYKKFIVSLCQSRNKGPVQLLLLICKFHSLSYDSASVSVRDSSCVTQSRRIANPGNCLPTICAKKNSFSSKTRQRRAVIEKQQGTV